MGRRRPGDGLLCPWETGQEGILEETEEFHHFLRHFPLDIFYVLYYPVFFISICMEGVFFPGMEHYYHPPWYFLVSQVLIFSTYVPGTTVPGSIEGRTYVQRPIVRNIYPFFCFVQHNEK